MGVEESGIRHALAHISVLCSECSGCRNKIKIPKECVFREISMHAAVLFSSERAFERHITCCLKDSQNQTCFRFL